jgi:hypothetical protein
VLTKDRDKKEALIKEFVSKILEQYPPQKKWAISSVQLADKA